MDNNRAFENGTSNKALQSEGHAVYDCKHQAKLQYLV